MNNYKILIVFIFLGLFLFNSCKPELPPSQWACESLNRGLRDALKGSGHPVCSETNLCEWDSKNNYCQVRYPEAYIGLVDSGYCEDEIFGYLDIITPKNISYCSAKERFESKDDCPPLKDRDYKTILETNTLELVTPVCASSFAKNKRDACIYINEFFIEELTRKDPVNAPAAIEKHKAVYTDKENNYCINKYSKTNNIYIQPSNAYNCVFKYSKIDFETLSSLAGKELSYSYCD